MKAKSKPAILVVDDTLTTLEVIKRNLEIEDYRVFTATSVAVAIEQLQNGPIIDLVITDYKMPQHSGLDLIRYVHEKYPATRCMMITGYASIDIAISAIKEGADEYLTKPFTDQELISTVQNILKKRILFRGPDQAEESLLHNQQGPYFAKHSFGQYGIIGQSASMLKVFNAIERAGKSRTTTLITGESGTGKELVARAIHYSDPKKSSLPFITVNCSAIPENLFESELFGHTKGAFTGANQTKKGLFHAADGGTIFLDEIGEISMAMQAKLLRTLQNKEIQMVGKCHPEQVDVHVIAATNKDLATLSKKGFFRQDLFFRLNVLQIDIPPLRERADDLFLLTNFFLKKFSAEHDLSDPPTITDRAWSAFKNYNWPGNVRELENVIHRCVIMSESHCIDTPDLPGTLHAPLNCCNNVNFSLVQVEQQHIQRVLAFTNGNKSKAAEILGIDRKTLRDKLKVEERI